MGRRRNSAAVITLPKLGPNGDLARAENNRVASLLARDASDREREGRRLKHGYNDTPAALHHYEALDLDKTVGERRYRALPGDHPLVKAYLKRKIPETEFNAGNIYRLIFEIANDPAGNDSTAKLNISRSRAGDGECAFLAERQNCRAALSSLHAKMGRIDAEIVQKFCGLALPIAAAVDSTVICAPAGRLFRVREALRALELAVKGGNIPDMAPELDRTADRTGTDS